MKYILALLGGIATGAALFALLLYLNPLASRTIMSPLAVTSSPRQMEFSFPVAPNEAIAATGSTLWGDPTWPPQLQTLWEPTVRDTSVLVSLLRNSRGQLAGLGVKFSTVAEETGLLNGVYPVSSAWHLWLLGRGGLMIDQSENHWLLLRDVLLPAWLSSADSWRGSWYGILTNGPNAIGTGRVIGGSGTLAGATGESVEAVNARAYSIAQGPVSMEGRLTVALAAPGQ